MNQTENENRAAYEKAETEKRAAIEKLAPNRRTYTTYRFSDAARDKLQRLIDSKAYESTGIDLIYVEWEDEKLITGTLEGHEFTGHQVHSMYFVTYLFPTKRGTWFSLGNNHFRLPLPYNESLVKDNEARGVKPSPELFAAMQEEEARTTPKTEPEVKPKPTETEEEKTITVADLMRETGISKQAISKRIQRLVRDGLIDEAALSERKLKKYFDSATAETIKANPKSKKAKRQPIIIG